MRKLAFILLLLLLALNMTGCSLFESENDIPIEMVAFSSLTDEEKVLIIASPKDSIVKKVSVNGEIKSVMDKYYNKDEVYSITIHHTATNSSGNLMDLPPRSA